MSYKNDMVLGKEKACTSHILNLIQFIENSLKKKKVFGVVFIYLMTAYDTVSYLLEKQLNKKHFTQIVEALLRYRSDYVILESKKNK